MPAHPQAFPGILEGARPAAGTGDPGRTRALGVTPEAKSATMGT
jgi:hypothetical protein